jgi:hypothetical protein
MVVLPDAGNPVNQMILPLCLSMIPQLTPMKNSWPSVVRKNLFI